MTTTTDALVRIALAGTGQGTPEVATGTAVDAITASLSGAEPARRLLLTAGAWDVFRQAGLTPDPPPELPAPAGEETRAVCSRSVAEKVRELCSGKRKDLLIEVGRCLDAAGQRLPPEVLPAVLGIREEKIRAALLPALGERGRWLGRFRDAWQWAACRDEAGDVLPEDADAVWEEGTADRRLALLRLARRLDAARSRDWLTRVWKTEKVPQRLAFLETFAEGLGGDDEPFLQTLLDDRSQQVRAKAAELLAQLPGSALSGRLRRRADTLLAWRVKTRRLIPPRSPLMTRGDAPAQPTRGLVGRVRKAAGKTAGTLDVLLPDELDPAWERDGIRATVPAAVALGRRSWWLFQVLEKVPPRHWQERFAAPPEELVAAAAATDWATTILEAWTLAAARFGCRGWLAPLWDWWRKYRQADDQAGLIDRMLAHLAAAMAPAELEPRIVALLEKPRQGIDRAALLAALPTPWTPDLARAFLAAGRREAARAGDRQDVPLWAGLAARAVVLPPEVLDEAAGGWPELDRSHWRKAECGREIEQFREVIAIRQTLIREIAP